MDRLALVHDAFFVPPEDTSRQKRQTFAQFQSDYTARVTGSDAPEAPDPDSAADEPQPDVILLVAHGSYNPPHRDHIRMMFYARSMVLQSFGKTKAEAAKKGLPWRQPEVLGAIGVTSSGWLQHKGLKEDDRFSDEFRRELLMLAVQDEVAEDTAAGQAADMPWLFVAPTLLSTKNGSSNSMGRQLICKNVLGSKHSWAGDHILTTESPPISMRMYPALKWPSPQTCGIDSAGQRPFSKAKCS